MQYPGNRSWIEDHGRIWFFSVLKSLPLGWLCNSDKFFRLLQLKKSVSIYLELCKIWLLPGPVTFLLWASCNQLLYPRPLVPALTQTRPFAQPSHPPTLLWELTSVSMFAKRSSTLGSASYLLLDNNQNFRFLLSFPGHKDPATSFLTSVLPNPLLTTSPITTCPKFLSIGYCIGFFSSLFLLLLPVINYLLLDNKSPNRMTHKQRIVQF